MNHERASRGVKNSSNFSNSKFSNFTNINIPECFHGAEANGESLGHARPGVVLETENDSFVSEFHGFGENIDSQNQGPEGRKIRSYGSFDVVERSTPVAKNTENMDYNQVQGDYYLPSDQSSGKTNGIDVTNKLVNFREMVGGKRSRDQTYSLSKNGTYNRNYCSGNQQTNSSRRISEIFGSENWQTISETPGEFSQNNTTVTLESEQRIPVNQYSSHAQRSFLVSGPDINIRNQWRPNEVRGTDYFTDRRGTFAGVDGEPRRTQNENNQLRNSDKDYPISRLAKVLLRNMGNSGEYFRLRQNNAGNANRETNVSRANSSERHNGFQNRNINHINSNSGNARRDAPAAAASRPAN
ncbi:hypothetical protein JTB14_015039 [Gonioctena quinquepunctata]|nr:hypothetical protein JTB14_015039 [Gonioctena quinquepunctata]